MDIIDSSAENLTDIDVLNRLKKLILDLYVLLFMVKMSILGTTNMSGATRTSKYLKSQNYDKKIVFIGSHVQALPLETIQNEEKH